MTRKTYAALEDICSVYTTWHYNAWCFQLKVIITLLIYTYTVRSSKPSVTILRAYTNYNCTI